MRRNIYRLLSDNRDLSNQMVVMTRQSYFYEIKLMAVREELRQTRSLLHEREQAAASALASSNERFALTGTSITPRVSLGFIEPHGPYPLTENSKDLEKFYADISANTAQGGYLNNVNSWEFKERLLSAFMRAEYAYKEKYLVSGILRRDGSSKFGPNSRWGIFPTISGGWLLSEEDFFKSKSIDYLKLRMSYGVSGNDQIPNFAYRALLNGEGVYVFDDLITQGAAIGRPANPDLKWETTRQFNVGVDLTWLKVLNFTTNYWIIFTTRFLAGLFQVVFVVYFPVWIDQHAPKKS
jgi:hypothetical protein